MALAKKCDICNKLYETYNFRKNQNKPSGIMLVNVCTNGDYFQGDVIDCCPDCMNAINNVIKSLRPAGPMPCADEPMEE